MNTIWYRWGFYLNLKIREKIIAHKCIIKNITFYTPKNLGHMTLHYDIISSIAFSTRFYHLLFMYSPLFSVSGVWKVLSYFTSSFNTWVIFAIGSGWEYLRDILVRLCLIVHPTIYSSLTIDKVEYYLFMYFNVYINTSSYPIYII